MYRKAVTNKAAGGILAIALTGMFIAATVFLSQFEKTTLFITAVCVLFLIAVVFSMLGYKLRLTEIQTQFPGDLESGVDRCTEQAAGKYFFFPDRLVDLANARIYRYEDIAEAAGLLVSYPHQHGDLHRRQGANVIIRMKNGRQYTLGYFQNGLVPNVYEIRENYAVFSELMHKYCKNWMQTKE